MIKFYRGNYADLSAKFESPNNICFCEDRQVLIMGGKEYGKDSGVVKVDSGMGGLSRTDSRSVASGTLFAFQGDQSLWMYGGGSTWSRIYDPTLSSADAIVSGSGTDGATIYDNRAKWTGTGASGDMYQATLADVTKIADNIESKISGAYSQHAVKDPVDATNKVIVSDVNGIAKSNFNLIQERTTIAVVTDGTGQLSFGADSEQAYTLVTEKTLSEQTNDILANGLEVRKITSTDDLIGAQSGLYNEGFRSQYGIFDKQTNKVLGTTIDLVKDQFLKSAYYTPAWKGTDGTWYNYYTPSGTNDQRAEGWYATDAAGELTGGAVTSTTVTGLPEKNTAKRYLKFIFALTNKTDDGAAVPGENDSVVYIDVNELFDSYVGVSGVAVEQASNLISGVVAPTGTTVLLNNETGDTGTGKRGTHYQSAFLTVNTNGFAISGIKQEITAYIQDISGITASGVANVTTDASTYSATGDSSTAVYPVFLTEVGIGTDGKLSGTASGINATGIKFNGFSGNAGGNVYTIPTGSVANALSSIGEHIDGLEMTYDGDGVDKTNTAEATNFIYAITQKNGQIAVSGKSIDASNLRFPSFQTANLSACSGSLDNLNHTSKISAIYVGNSTGTATVSIADALTSLATSVHDTISAMDLPMVGRTAGTQLLNGTEGMTAPSGNAATAEANKVINTIKQSDGHVYANAIDLVPENIYFSGIAAQTGNTATARVAVAGYNVDSALNSISNTIAKLDYTGHDEGSAPTSGGTTKWTITKEVTQTDGLIDEEELELTAGNTFFAAIDGKLGFTGNQTASVTPTTARVALLADDTTQANLGGTGKNGSVQMALDNISNILADYLSFHDSTGNII